ncbi:MAG: ABC transporter substrate-binding protein [Nocardioidaceae bacterium]
MSGLAACGGGSDTFSSGASKGTVTVGSANFPESELLMYMYADALAKAGVKVKTQPNIGAREVYIKALNDGSINMFPEYSGALLAYQLHNKVPANLTSPSEVYAKLKANLPAGTTAANMSSAQDKDTISVTPATAKKYHLKTISDLAPVAGKLAVGGPPEWKTRYQGLIGLKKLYGVSFGTFKPLDAGGPLTAKALEDGDVQAGNIFSTDSAIAQGKFVALDDPKNLFLAENITPIIKKSLVNAKITKTVNAVSAALNTQNLTAALAKVQVQKQDPKAVADAFLKAHNLS